MSAGIGVAGSILLAKRTSARCEHVLQIMVLPVRVLSTVAVDPSCPLILDICDAWTDDFARSRTGGVEFEYDP
jgi:hypothetical protein